MSGGEMTHEYKILVMTSDKYLWSIKPLGWLMDKYWPDHPSVHVAGFAAPTFELPRGFEFFSVGNMRDFPIDKWGHQLILALRRMRAMGEKVVFLMLEDMWPIEKVDSKVLQMMCDYMHQFEYVARFDATGDRLYAGGATDYGKLADIGLILSDPQSQYHLSMMPAFWRIDHLLKVLKPTWSPWDVELKGTPALAKQSDMIVLGTNAWPYHNTLAFRSGDSGTLLLSELDAEDVRAMREEGILPA